MISAVFSLGMAIAGMTAADDWPVGWDRDEQVDVITDERLRSAVYVTERRQMYSVTCQAGLLATSYSQHRELMSALHEGAVWTYRVDQEDAQTVPADNKVAFARPARGHDRTVVEAYLGASERLALRIDRTHEMVIPADEEGRAAVRWALEDCPG